MKKILNYFKDNRFIAIAFIPIALYNMISSYYALKKEWKAFTDSVNENDDFFKALATIGYTPNGMSLEVVKEVDEHYSSDEIQEIAKKNLISVVLSYVRDEQLLGVINLYCTMKSRYEVRVTILPTSYSVHLNDKLDFKYSVILWSIILFLIGVVKFIFLSV